MVTCEKCNHRWPLSGEDKYPFFCHKCGWDPEIGMSLPMLKEGYPWGTFDYTKDDAETQPNGGKVKKAKPNDLGMTSPRVSDMVEEKDGPCWSGYEMVGWKMKDGKKVPNCVPMKEEQHTPDHEDELTKGEYCPRCLAEYMIRKKLGTLEEGEYQGRKVPLGKPMRGDVKKFKVFVKDPSTGNVKKVNFGDKTMRIKKSNPARRKSFRARHNCANPGPRTKARFWSCRKW